jgi:hypothetical protein
LGERESDPARLKEAVADYREALKERTREKVPLDWANLLACRTSKAVWYRPGLDRAPAQPLRHGHSQRAKANGWTTERDGSGPHFHFRTGERLMHTDFYAFGEILWDCLPSGKHAGGALFNVTAHLAQLGVSASLISSVRDALGDEILEVGGHKKVNVEFVSRVRIGNQSPEESPECRGESARVHFRFPGGPLALQPRPTGSFAGGEWSGEISRRQSPASLRRPVLSYGSR